MATSLITKKHDARSPWLTILSPARYFSWIMMLAMLDFCSRVRLSENKQPKNLMFSMKEKFSACCFVFRSSSFRLNCCLSRAQKKLFSTHLTEADLGAL